MIKDEEYCKKWFRDGYENSGRGKVNNRGSLVPNISFRLWTDVVLIFIDLWPHKAELSPLSRPQCIPRLYIHHLHPCVRNELPRGSLHHPILAGECDTGGEFRHSVSFPEHNARGPQVELVDQRLAERGCSYKGGFNLLEKIICQFTEREYCGSGFLPRPSGRRWHLDGWPGSWPVGELTAKS